MLLLRYKLGEPAKASSPKIENLVILLRARKVAPTNYQIFIDVTQNIEGVGRGENILIGKDQALRHRIYILLFHSRSFLLLTQQWG